MKSFILGLLLVAGMLFGISEFSNAHLASFLNKEGLIVVLGGTFAVFMMNSRFFDLKFLFKNFIKLLSIDDRKRKLKQDLLSCTQYFSRGQVPGPTGNEWIDQSIEWISTGLRGEDLDKLLLEKANIRLDQLYRTATMLQNLAKYPPALGMIGTVIGIVSIFQGLGQEGNQAFLAQNLAVAMSSTLYGLTLSNFFISPVSELYIQSIQKKEEEINLIVETAKMWSKNENSVYIQEHIELYDVA